MRKFSARVAIGLEDAWSRLWPLPRGKGLAKRFHNSLFALGVIRPFWTVINGNQHYIDSRDHISKLLFRDGEYEPTVLNTILDDLGPGAVFVEVGAHIGYITFQAARRIGSDGRVIAIEANPSTAKVLAAGLERNQLPNVKLIQMACSEKSGKVQLYLSSFMNIGKTSLSAINAGTQQSVEVQSEPLDAIVREENLDRCDVVKIDVEGAELQVLKGMTETLTRFRPKLVLEIIPDLLANFGTSKHEVVNFLAQRGYQYRQIDCNDFVFLPSEPA